MTRHRLGLKGAKVNHRRVATAAEAQEHAAVALVGHARHRQERLAANALRAQDEHVAHGLRVRPLVHERAEHLVAPQLGVQRPAVGAVCEVKRRHHNLIHQPLRLMRPERVLVVWVRRIRHQQVRGAHRLAARARHDAVHQVEHAWDEATQERGAHGAGVGCIVHVALHSSREARALEAVCVARKRKAHLASNVIHQTLVLVVGTLGGRRAGRRARAFSHCPVAAVLDQLREAAND